jgi:hypothetical protein
MILLTAFLFFFATVSVCIFYITAEIIVRPKRWWRVFFFIIPLLALGVGMAVNNAKAVLEAVFGKPSEFVRTPKFGESQEGSKSIEKRAANYKALKSVIVPVLELMFGLFFASVEIVNLSHFFYAWDWSALVNFFLMSPFLGFFYTSLCSFARLIDGVRQRKRAAAESSAS